MHRQVLSEDELQALIRDEASKHSARAGALLFGVFSTPPDDGGCHWRMSTTPGGVTDKCCEALAQFVLRLGARYDIPNPRRGVTYRDYHLALKAVSEFVAGARKYAPTWVIVRELQLRQSGTCDEQLETPQHAVALAENCAIAAVNGLFRSRVFA